MGGLVKQKKSDFQVSNTEIEILESYRSWNKWIDKNLPEPYFRAIDHDSRNLLIYSLVHFGSTKGASTSMNQEGYFIITLDQEDLLLEELEQLLEHNFKGVYLTTPQSSIDVGGKKKKIKFARLIQNDQCKYIECGFEKKQKKEAVWKIVREKDSQITKAEYEHIISRLDQWFLQLHEESFLAENILLFHRARVDINVKVMVLEPQDRQKSEICFAIACRRSSKTGFLLNVLKVIQRFDFHVNRIHTVYVPEGQDDDSILTHVYLDTSRVSVKRLETTLSRLLESLSMVQWIEFENPSNKVFLFNLDFSIHHTLLLRSLEEFAFQMLVQVNESRFSFNNVHEAFTRYPDVCRGLVEYFSFRQNPIRRPQGRYKDYREKVIDHIEGLDSGIVENDERRKIILRLAVDFIDHILKTNYYCIRRSALSFRLAPEILDCVPFENRKAIYPELPYGFFFIKGKNFIAFNIRFRELSRGGVRTLLPRNKEHLEWLQKGIFRECYNLAYTQQFKNKDIPEGGSKSVIFVKPHLGIDREVALEKHLHMAASRSKLAEIVKDKRAALIRRQLFDAQRSFCDTLLDLLIWDDVEGCLDKKEIVDEYGKEELVFLGPDENMTDEMIEWISNRSRERGYRIGSSFMSGKKSMGINHKAYGVTSKGVHVFAKEALKSLNIDPKKGFSVKITGGPDGDVAGNELLNLGQEFGAKAKVLAITDGTGTIYDPKGLKHSEIKRLFKTAQGITHYKEELLSPGAFLLHIHERREIRPGSEEILKVEINSKSKIDRKWMPASRANHIYSHFLHQLDTDIFIPCGGRPRTLNAKNWKDFLNSKGEPSSRLIVEGANLYLSDEARSHLSQKGVMIFKDASANKCGVICSSYEILSGLLCNEEQFNKIKEPFVESVLEILEKRAQDEARLIINESQKTGKPTIALTDKVSDRINYFSDRIRDQIGIWREKGEGQKLYQSILNAYVPEILRGKKKLNTLPGIYLDSIVASFIASSLIYRHGLDYQPSVLDSITIELKDGLLE